VHSQGVIHRDIKIENLIFSQKRCGIKLKIVDFGLAILKTDQNPVFKSCGTPGYIAPEVIDSTTYLMYDEKCDIYSTGIVLFILLSGRFPY